MQDKEFPVSYKPGSLGHLLKLSTINQAAIDAFPRWLVMSCYALILFGLYLTILKGIIWIAIVFSGVSFFLLYQYGMKPSEQLIRFLEANPHAWLRYSGLDPEHLDPKLLNTSVEKLDARRAKFQQALAAKTGEDFALALAGADEEQESPAIDAIEAMRQHLESWDSSLFFAGSSRSGKTTASQHYAAVLKPFYFSLKPDWMPAGVNGCQGEFDSPDQLYYWLLPFYREFKYRVANRLEQEPPLWIFIDELETQLDELERWDKKQGKEAQKLFPETVSMLNKILKIGNAHGVKLGLVTQSNLSKNTRLDSDAMKALSWLLCGSEKGGFGAFKSDRLKSLCSDSTLGQVKLMTEHPDGVKGFWWLLELKGNFRLLPAPGPLPQSDLQQIPRFDLANHPYQGRQLPPGQDEPLSSPVESNGHNGNGKAAPKSFASGWTTTIKDAAAGFRDKVRSAVGVEDFKTVDIPARPVPRTALDEELDKTRAAIAGNSDLETQLDLCLPTLEQIHKDKRLDLLRIARLSMERGFITVRTIQKSGTPQHRAMSTGQILEQLNTLEQHYFLGAIYQADRESNIGYLVFEGDDRNASANNN